MPLRLQAPHPLSMCLPKLPHPQHSQYAVAHQYGLACGLQTEGRLLNTKHPCQDNVSQRPRRALLLMLMHAGTDGVCSTTDTAATVMLTSYLFIK